MNREPGTNYATKISILINEHNTIVSSAPRTQLRPTSFQSTCADTHEEIHSGDFNNTRGDIIGALKMIATNFSIQ